MAHSRSKGQRPQRERQQDTSREWNRSRTSQNYGEQDYSEHERFGGQSGYGGSQGVYGSQGGYRSMNFSDQFRNPRGESEYQGSREYRGEPRRGQQEWRSPESGRESANRWEERRPQYRENPPDRVYPQWGNEAESDDMQRGQWEGGMEPDRGMERQGSNVTRFGQRGMEQESGDRWTTERHNDRSHEGSQQRGRSGSPSSSSPSSQWGMQQGRQSFAGKGPQGYKRSDERITEDINEELTQDAQLDASDVSVEVKNGEIVLKGTVPDRESKRRAEEIAESCSGVKDVLNQLRIKREDSSASEASRRDKSDDKRNEDKRNKVAS